MFILDSQNTLLRDDLGANLFVRLCGHALFPARLDTKQVQAVRRILDPEVCIPMPVTVQRSLLDLEQEQIAKSYLQVGLGSEGQIVARISMLELCVGSWASRKSLILLNRAE